MSPDSTDELVSCDDCAVVFDRTKVGDFVRCPVCDYGVRKTTPVPKLGRVHKWWSEVTA
jgi:hypothetical protein